MARPGNKKHRAGSGSSYDGSNDGSNDGDDDVDDDDDEDIDDDDRQDDDEDDHRLCTSATAVALPLMCVVVV